MPVSEKTVIAGTSGNIGKSGGIDGSTAVNKSAVNQFSSYLTKESDANALQYEGDKGQNLQVADNEATPLPSLSEAESDSKGTADFPENYADLVQSRGLRRRGDPYNNPLETGYLLDIRETVQFDAVMHQHQSLIVNEAEKYGLDPRALAGALEWEYHENPRGWISDSFQIGPLDKLMDDPGLGFGSMHNSVVQNFFPEWDFETSTKARMYIDTAVPLMAAQMDFQATRFESGINAFLESKGIDGQVSVRDNPVMLSWLYNTSTDSVDRSVSKQISLLENQITEEAPLSLHLNIYENKLGKSQVGMAPWIEENLGNYNSYNSSQIDKNERSIPLVFEKNDTCCRSGLTL